MGNCEPKENYEKDLFRLAFTTTNVQARKEANVWVPLFSEPMWLITTDRVESARAHGLYGGGIYKGLDIKLTR